MSKKEENKHGQNPGKRRPRKKKNKVLIISITIISVCAAVVIGGLIYVYALLGKVNTDTSFDQSDVNLTDTYAEFDNKIINIALFGTDQRANENARSDAIMILTVDTVHGKLKLTSVMRDSYVPIDGHGKTKINAAYAWGGPTLAVKTLNQIFDLNIKDYVSVNFSQLAQVVDAMGGVTIDVKQKEISYINECILEYANINNVTPTYIKNSGEQLLNGMQALGYARIRYVGNGDYERTERQRTVLEQLFNKALALSPTQYPSVLSELLPLVTTSLDSNEILGLGTKVLSKGKPVLEQGRFPLDKDVTGGMVNGTSYVIYDLDDAKEKMHRFIYEDVPFSEIIDPPATSSANGSGASGKTTFKAA